MSRACKPTPDKPMSYILDALKQADAERQRGTVPSLHARQMTSPAPPAASGVRNRLWLAGGGALVLGAMATGLWFWRAPAGDARLPAADIALPSPMPSKPVAQPLPTPAPATPPPPAAAAEPAPQPAARQQQAVVAPSSAASPAAGRSVPKPTPATATPPPLKPKPKTDTVAARPAVQNAAGAAPSPPVPVAKASAASRAAPASVPLLSELPEDIRRQLPALTINGVVYSENPGARVLLVNQQVLTQGSLAAPEVTLEEIRARSSVFSFRGTRFRLAH